MNKEHGWTAFCPVYHHAIELIGRRWTGAILRALFSGETRFSEVTASVPGLSDRLLSERLKELEAEGIVTRTVFPETPVRIEYHLTEKGRALGQVMDAIAQWAEEWVEPAQAEQKCIEAGELAGAGAGRE
jgi:DNA-binding HxlR family transcriptional regulator